MKSLFGAAALAVALMASASPEALAKSDDCVAMINKVQGRIGDTSRRESRSNVQRELDAAHQAYKSGDRSGCLRHAERAADMVRDGGFSGSSREPDRYYDRRSDDRYYDRRSDDRYYDRRSDDRWGR